MSRDSVVGTATRCGLNIPGIESWCGRGFLHPFRPSLETTQPLIRGGADKPLVRPVRKQATATKLGIYSTFSPRSSVHFLAHCSNLYKPLKKIPECCPSNQVSAAAINSVSDEKWRHFNCFLVQGAGGSPTGPDPENRVSDQENGSPGRPVSSGLQVPGEPGHCRAISRPP